MLRGAGEPLHPKSVSGALHHDTVPVLCHQQAVHTHRGDTRGDTHATCPTCQCPPVHCRAPEGELLVALWGWPWPHAPATPARLGAIHAISWGSIPSTCRQPTGLPKTLDTGTSHAPARQQTALLAKCWESLELARCPDTTRDGYGEGHSPSLLTPTERGSSPVITA